MTTNQFKRPSNTMLQAAFRGMLILALSSVWIAEAHASVKQDSSQLAGVNLSGEKTDTKTEYSKNPLTDSEQTSGNEMASEMRAQPKLKDGLYLILRENTTKSQVEPAASNEEIVINDFEFLDPSERETTTYLAVSSEQFIPFVFSNDPSKGTDDKGRTKLLLQLADDQIKPLEEFTEKNAGKSVAIIIGGKVVTTHKIRESIKGGKLQITRCSDFGCDVLFTQLLKDSK